MSTQTISFRTGPPRSGNGMPLPTGSSIPVMRPRMDLTATQIVDELREALTELADTPCSFWACEGPRKPRDMVTCGKCWTMRRLARLEASLRAKLDSAASNKPQANPVSERNDKL